MNGTDDQFPLVAPVQLDTQVDDSVAHSLALLSKVYHYNHWIFQSLRDYLGPRVLEVGAGVGNITQFVLNQDSVACLEPFEPYRRYLATRFQKHLNVTMHPYPIEEVPNDAVPAGSFDSVLCINVLEHIAQDVDALDRMRRLTVPGGSVIVFVPALPCIYGCMDKAMGHYRRYTLRSLRKAFLAAGLEPRGGKYMNMLGVPAWWFQGKIRKRAKLSAPATKAFDQLVPYLSAFERFLPTPFGQSVFLVGRNPA